MPKVSIIIPMFNAARYIRETLESVLDQTLQDIQVICVDDASQDDTIEIISSYEDPRILLLQNSLNSGTGATINVGLRAATGEYVQVLGHDDLLEAEAMEQLYSFCTREGIECCQYGVKAFLDDDTDMLAQKRKDEAERYHEIKHEYGVMSGIELLESSTENNEYRMNNGPEFISRALLLDNNIINPEGVHHEDMLFSYRVLLAANKATLLSSRYYRYRIHLDSLQAQRSERSQTAEEALSLLELTMGMYNATPKELVGSSEFEPVMRRHIDVYLSRAATLYGSLPEEEKERFDTRAQKSFRFLLPLFALVRQKTKTLSQTEEEIRIVKQSNIYQLSDALLHFPRKVRKAIRKCFPRR